VRNWRTGNLTQPSLLAAGCPNPYRRDGAPGRPQELRDLFRLAPEELARSATQAQLHALHGGQRAASPALAAHLAELAALPGVAGAPARPRPACLRGSRQCIGPAASSDLRRACNAPGRGGHAHALTFARTGDKQPWPLDKPTPPSVSSSTHPGSDATAGARRERPRPALQREG